MEEKLDQIIQLLQNPPLSADIAVSAIGVIIALAAASIAFISYKKEQKRRSIENAVALAKVYENEVLSKIGWVTAVFQMSNMAQFIRDNLDVSGYEELHFTTEELSDIISDGKTQEDYLREFNIIDPKVISFYRRYWGISSPGGEPILDPETDQDQRGYLARIDLGLGIDKLLNSLEWFSMNFKTNIADESAVYQSLHQTFLACVRYLYFDIASKNKNGYDKVYTNIIWLYNLWNRRVLDAGREEAVRRIQAEENLKKARRDAEKESVHQGNKL